MKNNNFKSEQVSEQINTVICSADQNRNESLQQFSELQSIQVELLQTERTRLLRKYGTSTHPRVKRIEAKLNVATGLNREFQAEVEKTRVEVPPFNRKTWRIHGRVLTQDRQGIEGLTVSLFDKEKKWVRELDFTCTNERGYFVIDYLPKDSASDKPTISQSQPLILTVTDRDRQILHQEKRPLFIKLGVIDYREIILDPNQKSKTPPEPDNPKTLPPRS